MYIVDIKNKELRKAEKCTFKSLNLKERQDLQEWIAKEPSTLGEELLIIQKEFAGFADTKERLDLLALDKNGCLVIIENKLDDSGRDVTWQAIKYASYCSSLSKQDIINIYQDYLGTDANAAEMISEFFNGQDIEDIIINEGNTQRIFLVAANFQKEVTSSVLWLQNFNLRMKCFKVTPFRYNDQVMVDFDQIIPIEDAEDYQIRIASKKQEENEMAESTKVRYNNRKQFWNEFIDYCKEKNGIFSSNSATTDNWIGKSVKSIVGANLNVIINKDGCRTEIYINTGDKEFNKKIYDKLFSRKEDIEQDISGLVWQRMDDKVTCRIRLDEKYIYLNESDKKQLFEFFVTSSNKMMDVFTKYGNTLNLNHR